LVEVGEEFDVHEDTLFLSIAYVDKYLSKMNHPMRRGKLQLLGLASLLLASKLEEVHVPTVEELIFISDATYKNDDILQMEGNILNILKFDMTIRTSRHFLQHFLRAAEMEMAARGDTLEQRIHLSHVANYLLELTLVEYSIVHTYKPSLLAASVLSLSLKICQMDAWGAGLRKETNFRISDLHVCGAAVDKIYREAPASNLRSVQNKYAQEKRNRISTAPVVHIEFPLVAPDEQ